MSANQTFFPFARKAWGARTQEVQLMPAGQSVICSVSEAKTLYATAKRLGRRSQVLRVLGNDENRMFTVWT